MPAKYNPYRDNPKRTKCEERIYDQGYDQGVKEVVDYLSRHWMGATKGMLIYEIPDKDRISLEEGIVPNERDGG